jgi:predicted nucleic acid-binding protein
MLVDSNIVIYSADPAYAGLREWLARTSTAVSAISRVEVLGFHRLTPQDEATFREWFRTAKVMPVNDDVLQGAIVLRRQRPIGLADAVIAATALLHTGKLATRNVRDFGWIPGLTVVNPVDPAP